MKLKKIASLMLAGVMAVSMLAGCQTTSNGNDQPTQPEEPTTNNVVAAIQNGIDSHNPNLKVTVAGSSMLDQRMDKIFDTASAHKDDDAFVAMNIKDVFDISDNNFDADNSDFMSNAGVLPIIASADDGARKNDTIWAYTLIKVTNDNGNPYVTAGDKIGEAFAAADLSNKFADESEDDDVLAYLSADYTLFVYGGQTVQPNNDVDTYVVAVLQADYSQVSA